MLPSANGDNFIVAQFVYFTRIAKYLPDGRLDSSYGNAGYSDAANMSCTSAVMQGDKIIVAGSYFNSVFGSKAIAVARYTANGILDSSFGVNGLVITDFYYLNDDDANSIVLQGDKIVVAGSTVTFSNDFVLVRYTKNGTMDSSFGVNGKVTTDFNGSDDFGNSMTLQEGKFIVAGSTGDFPDFDFALARYNADGMLDSSFGVNGKVTTDFDNSADFATSIALQGNRIIVGGET